MAKIAVLGYGTVGSGVVNVLDTNAEDVKLSAGEAVEVKYILDLRDFPGDKHEAQVVHDIEIILNDPEVEVICETMGGLEPAFTFEKRALEKGKSVCTSNKELVAAHGPELVELARQHGVSYLFEASVGGGIPVLRSINDSLKHEKIDAITGILNGTTNYILTKMDKEGADFDTVLKDAQDKGYAERNPEADVEGYDACRKIAILASLMSGKHVQYEDIYTEGISKINTADFAYARSLNMAIKLLGMCKKNSTGFYTMVAPFLIPMENSLANVNGVFNAINVHGNMLGDVMFYGKGAGKNATASAVVADVIDILKHRGRHIAVNMNAEKADLAPKDSAVRQFFVRVPENEKDKLFDIFGPEIDIVKAPEVQGEVAVITDLISEKDFEEKLKKLDEVKGYLRLF
ncbi:MULTISPECIES: homoserine dehydrogenase [unclassified Butyrivibrio]|uniref:homoserine dehydrogenase n=1 Tax=unclassified Butyrivibrio TaxID=2639466 RepID=UPI0003FF5344|nr:MULTISPECIES: homoserine dehydrogenase [unclassified Butyrivibrio]MDC7294887.1 homoserine dehydrogenase [Butyrivibrio sp. DSM 10294]